MNRCVVASCLVLGACALFPRRGTPSSLRGYDVLIAARDSLSDYLARAMAGKGFTVRRHIKGGSPPTAALITFTFRELGESPTAWFDARLADTRRGVIVAAVSAPLESLGPSAAARAQSLADSFAARLSHPAVSPP